MKKFLKKTVGEKMYERTNPLSDYGLKIKAAILLRGKTQRWLIEEIKKMETDIYVDSSVLNKVLTGKITRGKLIDAINHILFKVEGKVDQQFRVRKIQSEEGDRMKITLKKQDDGSYSLTMGEQEIGNIVNSVSLETTAEKSVLTLKLKVIPLTSDDCVFSTEAL